MASVEGAAGLSAAMRCQHVLNGDRAFSCLGRYCTRLQAPSFWGGEVEILILSKMLKAPIYVFQRAEEAGRCAQDRFSQGLKIKSLTCK